MPLTAKEQERRDALAALAAQHGVTGPLNAAQLWWLGEAAPYLFARPARMHGGVVRYLLAGVMPGSFLAALFANDLIATLHAADDENSALLRGWGHLLYGGMPPESHGSVAKRDAWVAAGRLAAPAPAESVAA